MLSCCYVATYVRGWKHVFRSLVLLRKMRTLKYSLHSKKTPSSSRYSHSGGGGGRAGGSHRHSHAAAPAGNISFRFPSKPDATRRITFQSDVHCLAACGCCHLPWRPSTVLRAALSSPNPKLHTFYVYPTMEHVITRLQYSRLSLLLTDTYIVPSLVGYTTLPEVPFVEE